MSDPYTSISDLAIVLSRETPYSFAEILRWQGYLFASDWTPHQIRRGIHAIARSGGVLNVRHLYEGGELAGNIDRFLDSLVPKP